VDFGPRAPGTSGHSQARTYFLTTLRTYADAVTVQDFTHTGGGQTFTFTNILAEFNPTGSHPLLLGAHWDTRPLADQDPNPQNRSQPILGANDGASGVAVLLEIARVLKEHPPPRRVILALFDAEDLGQTPYAEEYSLGARYFAQHLGRFRPEEAIIVDMIGDRALRIYQEGHSLQFAPALVRKVFQTAAALGYPQFVPEPRYTIIDDHLPLLQAGIPAIDLIDFEYPEPPSPGRYWHTLEDTVDKCSSASLKAVGEVLLHLIFAAE